MSDVWNVSLNRRGFIGTGVAAGAMVLTVGLPGCGRQPAEQAEKTTQQLNAFVAVEPDGSVSVFTPFVEMGQGVHTAIPMLVAEELDVSLDQINVLEAPLGPEYRLHFGGAMRYTGSSLTIKDAFIPLRRAGAAARDMLLQSAAAQWNVPVGELTTDAGQVTHEASGRSSPYGEFLEAAAKLTPPDDVPLKDPADFRLIGTPADRLDMVEKTNGSAQFAIDADPEDCLVAAVQQSPVFGGTIAQLDADEALAMPGVVAVEAIPNGTYSIGEYVLTGPDHVPNDPIGTVAVIADSFWHAKSALAKLDVEYEGGAEGFSDEDFSRRLKSRTEEEGVPAESTGDVKAALEQAESTISAVYEVPPAGALVHGTHGLHGVCSRATAARYGPDTKMRIGSRKIASKILNIPGDNVTVNTPYLGGAFGRRSNNDYVVQAVSLAKKHPGRPIKLIWTREEDVQHDFYRPQVVARFQAGFDTEGNPTAFRHVNIGDGGQRQHGLAANAPFDPALMDSSTKQPYDIPNRSVEYLLEKIAIPVGFWRSVGGAHNGYFIESFVDEMAHAVDEDPVAFRRRLLGSAPRFEAVLDLVAEMADWRPQPWQAEDGRMHAMGVALHEDHYTIVAQIAEVSLDELDSPTVHKVWCSVDCGIVVNPTIATMQVESAISYGLSAALMEKVDVRDGKVVNSNFHDYPVLTAQQMPDIEVKFVASDAHPTGLGEPATPPIPAAVCNALFALTGERIRTLPIGRLQA